MEFTVNSSTAAVGDVGGTTEIKAENVTSYSSTLPAQCSEEYHFTNGILLVCT